MKIIEKEFEFVSLSTTETELSDLGKGIVRIRHEHGSEAKQKNTKRGTMVKLTTPHGKAYAILRYSSKLNSKQIAMEYDLSIQLTDGPTNGESIPVRISKVSLWNYGSFLSNHIDPIVRYADIVGIYRGVLGGVIGFILGAVATYIIGKINIDAAAGAISRLFSH